MEHILQKDHRHDSKIIFEPFQQTEETLERIREVDME